MSRRQREPLSDEEIEYLVQLANGNALTRHRHRERWRRRQTGAPPTDRNAE